MTVAEMFNEVQLRLQRYIEETEDAFSIDIACDVEELIETLQQAIVACPSCGGIMSMELCMQNTEAKTKCSKCRREFKLVEV